MPAAFAVMWLFLLAVQIGPANAQFKEEVAEKGPRLGPDAVHRLTVGLIVKAQNGPCGAISGTCPVPIDWPEQHVTVIQEDISPSVEVGFRMVADTVREMQIRIPELAAGQTAQALIVYELRRSTLVAPENTDEYQIPQRPEKPLRIYLGASPYIEIRDGRIRRAAREALGLATSKSEGLAEAPQLTAWETVEKLYDFARSKVEYKDGPLKGAAAALKEGTGDCEELTSLFIALCRIHHVPARTVWVDGHSYPEFYLEDADGEGHWFPCQAAGDRAFGGIPELRPILQKGDHFKIPGRGAAMRYVSEHLTGKKVRGQASPQVRFVRKIDLGPPPE